MGSTIDPTVHACYLCIKKPLDADKIGSVNYFKIKELIEQAPDLEDSLWNWGDLSSESTSSVIRKAAETYIIDHDNIVRGLFSLANDFYGNNVGEFNRMIYKTLGYDGIFKHQPNGSTHFVAFFPSQIKSVDAVTFDSGSNNIYV